MTSYVANPCPSVLDHSETLFGIYSCWVDNLWDGSVPRLIYYLVHFFFPNLIQFWIQPGFSIQCKKQTSPLHLCIVICIWMFELQSVQPLLLLLIICCNLKNYKRWRVGSSWWSRYWVWTWQEYWECWCQHNARTVWRQNRLHYRHNSQFRCCFRLEVFHKWMNLCMYCIHYCETRLVFPLPSGVEIEVIPSRWHIF